MQIQAYRRTAPITVDTGITELEFKVNAAGDVVVEVEDDDEIEILLNIPEAYREYAPVAAVKPVKAAKSEVVPPAAKVVAAAAGAESKPSDDAKPLILKGETEADDVNLGAMDMDKLKEFAKLNDYRVHHAWTLEVARQKVYERFATE